MLKLWKNSYLFLKSCCRSFNRHIGDREPLEIMNKELRKWKVNTEKWMRKQGLPFLLPDHPSKVITILMLLSAWPSITGLIVLTYTRHCGIGWRITVYVIHCIIVLMIMVVIVIQLRRKRTRKILQWASPKQIIGVSMYEALVPLITLIGPIPTRPAWLGIIAVLVPGIIFFLQLYHGLFSMLWGSIKSAFKHRWKIVEHSLPMLLFAAILFWSSEIWEAASNISVIAYFIVPSLFVVMGILYLNWGTKGLYKSMHKIDSWDVVLETLAKPRAMNKKERKKLLVPLIDITKGQAHFFIPHSHSKQEKFNIRFKLFISFAMLSFLTWVVAFLFFTILGALVIDVNLTTAWTNSSSEIKYESINLFGLEIQFTLELLAVAGFIALLAALRFVVKLFTDDAYKEYFIKEAEYEVNEALAVREIYLALFEPSGKRTGGRRWWRFWRRGRVGGEPVGVDELEAGG